MPFFRRLLSSKLRSPEFNLDAWLFSISSLWHEFTAVSLTGPKAASDTAWHGSCSALAGRRGSPFRMKELVQATFQRILRY